MSQNSQPPPWLRGDDLDRTEGAQASPPPHDRPSQPVEPSRATESAEGHTPQSAGTRDRRADHPDGRPPVPPPPRPGWSPIPEPGSDAPSQPVPQPFRPVAPQSNTAFHPGQGAVPPQQPPPAGAQNRAPNPGPGPGDLTPPPGLDQINLIRRSSRAPQSGWRRAVHRASGGTINPGDSARQQYIDHLIERVRQPIRGDFQLAVLSLKGGVGKTTSTIGLGSTFASLRGDRVIAVDANPDLGTLAGRVPQQTNSTVRTLLNDTAIGRYSDVRAHTSQALSRLEVLASERDPAVSEAFSDEDYRQVIDILRNHYNVLLTDCGTGLMHSAMKGVLQMANAILLITSPAIDGAQSASATLDWLNAHGYQRLVNQAVVVISSSQPGSAPVDVDMMTQHFLGRARAVQVVPYDSHLAEGSHVDLDLLNSNTKLAFLELAATVADAFPTTVGLPPTGAPQQWRG